MRTTVNINDALLQELKSRGTELGWPFRIVLQETISAGLATRARTEARSKFRVRSHDLNIKPEFRIQSFNQLYYRLESEDSAQ